MLIKKRKKFIRITLFYSISWIFCILVILFDVPFFHGSRYIPALKLLIYIAPIMWVVTIFFETIAVPKGVGDLVETNSDKDHPSQG